MIARLWRGATCAADAKQYLEYLKSTGFREYRTTPGNLGILALRRIRGHRAELVLVTLWEDQEAIRAFAGDDIERAVFYEEDERFLVAADRAVRHYEVVRDWRPDGTERPRRPGIWHWVRGAVRDLLVPRAHRAAYDPTGSPGGDRNAGEWNIAGFR